MLNRSITTVLLLLAVLGGNNAAARIRGAAVGKVVSVANATFGKQSRRVEMSHDDDFVPLSCNDNLDSVTCTPWSASPFGLGSTHSDRVVVACGTCLVMDHADSTLTFEDGIDIQGKLVFPDGFELHVISTMIAVQGELMMTSTKPVDGNELIRFTMIGQNTNSFTTIDENAGKCSGGDVCDVGKKVIVVAGGKVSSEYLDSFQRVIWDHQSVSNQFRCPNTVNGLPSNTPTCQKCCDHRCISVFPRSHGTPTPSHGHWKKFVLKNLVMLNVSRKMSFRYLRKRSHNVNENANRSLFASVLPHL